jgi:hypothetical protein
MSAGEPLRPRRGWQPDEDPDDPVVSDDTPEPTPSPARRGALPEEPGEEAPGDSAEVEAGAPHDDLPAPAANPFARPGSEAAAQSAPPAPVLPLSDTPIPAPVFPRSSGEFADSPSPAPRRSALSSTTPVEADPVAAAPHWFREHRRTLLAWGIGGLALALIVAVVVSLVVRGGLTTVPPTESPTPSVTQTEVPEAAGAADLVTVADLEGVAEGAWAITGTSHTAAEHDGRVACFQTNEDAANPTFSVQRTLATSEKEPVAALHRIDAFANEAVARMAFEERVAVLSACSEVPAQLQSANEVVGLAPEAFQLTVLFQEEKDRYHTVLLTLSGAVLQVLDVTQVGSPVDEETLAAALTRPQTQLSERQGEPAPQGVKVSPAELPSVAPEGWLIPSDLPRIRAGIGRWNMTSPGQLKSTGMGCEAMTLVRARPEGEGAGHLPDDPGRRGPRHLRHRRDALHVRQEEGRGRVRQEAGQCARVLQGPVSGGQRPGAGGGRDRDRGRQGHLAAVRDQHGDLGHEVRDLPADREPGEQGGDVLAHHRRRRLPLHRRAARRPGSPDGDPRRPGLTGPTLRPG